MDKKELLDAKITVLKEFLSAENNSESIEKLKNVQTKSNIINPNFSDREKEKQEIKQEKYNCRRE